MRISFCTTCMNRLFHLKETYLRNLENCSSYENAEFVLLDYNSTDGLIEWVEENLEDHTVSGRVKFYRTDEPRYWVAAHAKNVAHRLATGDILVNLDCDITVPGGFAEYVAESFSGKRIVMAFKSEDMSGNHGCAGLIGATREDFYSVNGYDERINLGWGCDDMNYQFRVRMQNKLELFTPPRMCSCIPHDNETRTKNCQLKDIEATREMSFSLCQDSASDKDYIANKNHEWGAAKLTEGLMRTLRA